MSFGERLRIARKRHKYTQVFVAEAVGVTQSSYGAWEGDTAYPLVPNLIKLCQLLEVGPSELLQDEVVIGVSNDTPFVETAAIVIRKNAEVMLQLVDMVGEYLPQSLPDTGNQSGKSPEKE